MTNINQINIYIKINKCMHFKVIFIIIVIYLGTNEFYLNMLKSKDQQFLKISLNLLQQIVFNYKKDNNSNNNNSNNSISNLGNNLNNNLSNNNSNNSNNNNLDTNKSIKNNKQIR